jgi:hypothetical protein
MEGAMISEAKESLYERLANRLVVHPFFNVDKEARLEWLTNLVLEQSNIELAVARNSLLAERDKPIAMLLWCPMCTRRHIDTGEFATRSHHSHACQHCGMVWRPAIEPTRGVEFLPGFKS